MIQASAADETDIVTGLIGNHAPAIHLLFVHPPWTVERRYECRVKRLYLERERSAHLFLFRIRVKGAALR
jgi:hypothetical protein